MLKEHGPSLTTAWHYDDLGKEYQQRNQKENSLIFFCKSFKLKTKFYQRFDNDDLRKTFSKIYQISTSHEVIHKYINSEGTSSADRDRFRAYFNSNVALTAYENENYLLSKERFTDALKSYQFMDRSDDNIELVNNYLKIIDAQKRSIFMELESPSSLLKREISYSVDYFVFRLICFMLTICIIGPCQIQQPRNDTREKIPSLIIKNTFRWHSNEYDTYRLLLDDSTKNRSYNKRQTHITIERYHNNTHPMYELFFLLNVLFHTSTDVQSKVSICQELFYYIFRDHFKDLTCFCNLYSSKSAIEWYRDDSGVNNILNKILRLKNFQQIFKFRHIIIDLYQQLNEVYRRQKPDNQDSMILTVYRGQQMYRYELRSLMKNINQFVFINSFFSTSFNQIIANTYGNPSGNTSESVAVVFIIEIDTLHETQPYAHIAQSADENEVIFCPGTIFRLQSIEKISYSSIQCNNMLSDNQNHDVWRVKLKTIDQKEFLGETLTLINNELIGPVSRS